MSLTARLSPAGDLFWQDWSQHPELAICSSVPEPQGYAFSPADTAGQPVSFSLSSAFESHLISDFLSWTGITHAEGFRFWQAWLYVLC